MSIFNLIFGNGFGSEGIGEINGEANIFADKYAAGLPVELDISGTFDVIKAVLVDNFSHKNLEAIAGDEEHLLDDIYDDHTQLLEDLEANIFEIHAQHVAIVDAFLATKG